jgi:hypothetical protein
MDEPKRPPPKPPRPKRRSVPDAVAALEREMMSGDPERMRRAADAWAAYCFGRRPGDTVH